MGITVIPRVIEHKASPIDLALEPEITVGDVVGEGKYYRHPDSARITYPLVAEQPLGTIPSGKKLNIGIIGGGISGIASYYELSRIENSKDLINFTLYELELENFVLNPPSSARSIVTFPKKAGRIFAARSVDNGTNHSVYELGAMRFPEIAGLTWHYANVIFGSEAKIGKFPNPGQIPTEFVCGDRVDRYVKDQWLDTNSPTKLISGIIIDGLQGKGPQQPNVSYYPIGGNDPAKISAELKDKDTLPARLEEIEKEWKEFAIEYDGLTLESAVRKIIRDKVSSLPQVQGLNNDEDKINYYVELFGIFGFGTGGFKSVFNMSLVEMIRLILWNYSNEYTLPVNENVEFVERIYQAAMLNNPHITVKPARVCDVCHSGIDDQAIVVSYERLKNGEEATIPTLDKFDYVILAVTSKQMNSMIARSGYRNTAQKVLLGDYGRQYPEELLIRPPLVLSNDFEAPNSKIFSAINQVRMVGSSKIFATIAESKLNEYAPDFKDYGKIKAILSDCGLANSYIVPSPFSKPLIKDGKTYYSFLISYNWEEDTKRLQHHLYEYPINKVPESKNNDLMINSAINRTIRQVKDPQDGQYKKWWFGDLLSNGNLSDTLSYDWTTEHSAGAFKLDTTGGHYNSNLCFRYHTHALKPELKNKFFIAGDSYSHLGGWIEASFMSAINAVTGLIVAANGGNTDKLTSDEVRNVMLTLDPVA